MPSGHKNTSITITQNSMEKEEKQNNRDEMNELYASEIRKREREDEVYCVCESCTKTNFFTRLKCEFCNNSVKKKQDDVKSKKSIEKNNELKRSTYILIIYF